MCTRAFWRKQPDHLVGGRNMDWGTEMEEKLWVFPKGMTRSSEGRVVGLSVEWTSKHGSIVTSVFNQATCDGVNESGLAAHALWLSESDYGPRDPKRPGIDTDQLLQYFLDNFATVKEVVAYVREVNPQVVPIKVKGDREVHCHMAMEDAHGESVVIEYLDGQPQIHYSGDELHARDLYDVLTNSPPFAKQLNNLSQYKGFGGDKDLPGTTDAADRFVRAASYLKSLPDAMNQREAIAGLLSVLRSCAQPFREPNEGAPYASATRWRTAVDLKDKLYMYESSLYPTLVWLRAGGDIFKKDVRYFDLTTERQAIGDVSDQLKPWKIPLR